MTISCVLCGATRSQVVSHYDRQSKPLVSRICLDCGLVFNDPIPDDSELAVFYSHHYRVEYKGAVEPRFRQIVRNFRRVRTHLEAFSDIVGHRRRVLDIGAGSGEFLFGMARQAERAVGIEPNKGYAEYCRKRLELDVRTDQLRQDLFEKGMFDLIRLNHVLEHLNDPVRSLGMIANFLSEDGVFYVEVPNIDIYALGKSAGNIFHYGHIFNFNPWTLRAAGRLAGLEEVAETRERCANTTGIFLQKAQTTWTPEMVRNPGNADRTILLLEQHAKDRPVISKVTRPLAKLRLRASETLFGLRYRTPMKIGRAILG